MTTQKIYVGGIPIGGGEKIPIQSMTNTQTENTGATIAQIIALAAAGCDIVRVAVPNTEAAEALRIIKPASPIPVVADIHFDYKLAILSAKNGADKIRVNPGNLGSDDKLRAVADACRGANIPIRVGVNSGSLPKQIIEKYGLTHEVKCRSEILAEAMCECAPMAEAMCECALGYADKLSSMGFYDICVSLKASDVKTTVLSYRLFSQKSGLPLHIGVTEAGSEYSGIIKSAAGIGALLIDNIGDTLRVSLTADPLREIRAAKAILKAAGKLHEGVNLISCPTCGRTQIDLIRLANEAETALEGIKTPVTVAVMGCAVNGPGEARHADYGIAGGIGEGVIFRKGEVLGRFPQEKLLEELLEIMKTDGIF